MTDDLPTRLRNILMRKPKTEEQTEQFERDLDKIIHDIETVQIEARRLMLRRRAAADE